MWSLNISSLCLHRILVLIFGLISRNSNEPLALISPGLLTPVLSVTKISWELVGEIKATVGVMGVRTPQKFRLGCSTPQILAYLVTCN